MWKKEIIVHIFFVTLLAYRHNQHGVNSYKFGAMVVATTTIRLSPWYPYSDHRRTHHEVLFLHTAQSAQSEPSRHL